ncbi:MAG: VOC family protein [Rhabdochlamydiaceae bacterium]
MPKFIYTGIHVSNIDISIAFYTKELGMKLLSKTKIRETGGEVAWLRSPGSKQILELNWYPKEYRFGGRQGLDHLAFEVDDAGKYFDKMKKKKHGTPLKPFKEGRWVLAYVRDPDGNWIELGHQEKKRRS